MLETLSAALALAVTVAGLPVEAVLSRIEHRHECNPVMTAVAASVRCKFTDFIWQPTTASFHKADEASTVFTLFLWPILLAHSICE